MLKVILEGMTEGKGGRGRLRFHYFKQIMEDVGTQSYYKMKRLAEDRGEWRKATINQSTD